MLERVYPLRRQLRMLLVAMLLTGCIGNQMQRGTDSVENGDGYSIAFVELDDLGELWMPSQVTRALASIESANQHPDGAVFVLFVHGWNHNAAAGDANVMGFRRQLERIVDGERTRVGMPPRPVVGVYVSWRGKTSSFLPLNLLTFYSRRGASERVASLAATETIYRLITHAKRNAHTRTVLLGHSFGGAILETALSQALVGFLIQNKGEDIDFPADLVVLINPASQAIRAKQFVEILARHRLRLYRMDDASELRFERPLIVSMTSSGDWVTGAAFPLGLGVKGLTKNYRSYGSDVCNAVTPQRLLYRKTAGHTRELLSHRVLTKPAPVPADVPKSVHEIAESLEGRYDPLSRLQSFVFDGATYQFTIQRLAGAFNDTPYWIMRVPTTILPDHGRIFGTDLQELLRALIVITGSFEPGARTVMVREDGVRPLGMSRRIDGQPGIYFLDRSRSIYKVAPDENPAFYACLPAEASAVENSLGFQQAGDTVLLGRVGHELDGASDRNRIDVLRLKLLANDTVADRRVRFDAGFRPSAIAFDVVGEQAFVARRGSPSLFVANLGAKHVEVQPLTNLGGVESVSLLLYEAGGRQLFASDGFDTVVRFPLGGEESRTEIVDHDLAVPTAIAFDPENRLLYVATRERMVWVYECPDRCGPGRVFTRLEAMMNPTALLVTEDGVVWVGDTEAQSIQCFSKDGVALGNHDRLPVD